LNKTSFDQDFETNFEKVRKKLSAYLRSPTVENVHDVRTELRRLQSQSRVLPKRSQKKLCKYLKLSRKVFKSTTKIRDSDIILDKLARYPALERKRTLESLRDRRKKLVSRSVKHARKLRTETLGFHSRDLKQGKLQKGYDKSVARLNAKIQILLPVVKDDQRKVDELHSLRKLSKQLRYLYELTIDKERVQLVKKWQKLLGKIHDNDIVIAYLSSRQAKDLEIAKIYRDLKRAREEQFQEFISGLEDRKNMKAAEELLSQDSSSPTIA
jgi:CHAD domain-containing protein